MRWILWFLLLSIAWCEVTPHRPVRCLRDRKAQLMTFETAISRFRHPQKGYQVDLIGVVHVGPKSYYQRLNKIFKQYDCVLYELIADGSAGKPVPIAHVEAGVDNPLALIQQGMSKALGLDFQLDWIDYNPTNLVHADVSMQEFQRSQRQRNETFVQLLLRSMKTGEEISPEAEKEMEQVDLFALMRQRPSLADQVHLRRFMALLFNQPEQMIEILEGPGGGTILSVRNQKALSVLGRELKRGRKKIAIFYGAAHMLDMEKRLVSNFGVRYVDQVWLPAWDLRLENK